MGGEYIFGNDISPEGRQQALEMYKLPYMKMAEDADRKTFQIMQGLCEAVYGKEAADKNPYKVGNNSYGVLGIKSVALDMERSGVLYAMMLLIADGMSYEDIFDPTAKLEEKKAAGERLKKFNVERNRKELALNFAKATDRIARDMPLELSGDIKKELYNPKLVILSKALFDTNQRFASGLLNLRGQMQEKYKEDGYEDYEKRGNEETDRIENIVAPYQIITRMLLELTSPPDAAAKGSTRKVRQILQSALAWKKLGARLSKGGDLNEPTTNEIATAIVSDAGMVIADCGQQVMDFGERFGLEDEEIAKIVMFVTGEELPDLDVVENIDPAMVREILAMDVEQVQNEIWEIGLTPRQVYEQAKNMPGKSFAQVFGVMKKNPASYVLSDQTKEQMKTVMEQTVADVDKIIAERLSQLHQKMYSLPEENRAYIQKLLTSVDGKKLIKEAFLKEERAKELMKFAQGITDPKEKFFLNKQALLMEKPGPGMRVLALAEYAAGLRWEKPDLAPVYKAVKKNKWNLTQEVEAGRASVSKEYTIALPPLKGRDYETYCREALGPLLTGMFGDLQDKSMNHLMADRICMDGVPIKSTLAGAQVFDKQLLMQRLMAGAANDRRIVFYPQNVVTGETFSEPVHLNLQMTDALKKQLLEMSVGENLRPKSKESEEAIAKKEQDHGDKLSAVEDITESGVYRQIQNHNFEGNQIAFGLSEAIFGKGSGKEPKPGETFRPCATGLSVQGNFKLSRSGLAYGAAILLAGGMSMDTLMDPEAALDEKRQAGEKLQSLIGRGAEGEKEMAGIFAEAIRKLSEDEPLHISENILENAANIRQRMVTMLMFEMGQEVMQSTPLEGEELNRVKELTVPYDMARSLENAYGRVEVGKASVWAGDYITVSHFLEEHHEEYFGEVLKDPSSYEAMRRKFVEERAVFQSSLSGEFKQLGIQADRFLITRDVLRNPSVSANKELALAKESGIVENVQDVSKKAQVLLQKVAKRREGMPDFIHAGKEERLRFAQVDPTGKSSVLELEVAERMALIETRLQFCNENTKNFAKKIATSDVFKKDMKELGKRGKQLSIIKEAKELCEKGSSEQEYLADKEAFYHTTGAAGYALDMLEYMTGISDKAPDKEAAGYIEKNYGISGGQIQRQTKVPDKVILKFEHSAKWECNRMLTEGYAVYQNMMVPKNKQAVLQLADDFDKGNYQGRTFEFSQEYLSEYAQNTVDRLLKSCYDKGKIPKDKTMEDMILINGKSLSSIQKENGENTADAKSLLASALMTDKNVTLITGGEHPKAVDVKSANAPNDVKAPEWNPWNRFWSRHGFYKEMLAQQQQYEIQLQHKEAVDQYMQQMEPVNKQIVPV